MDANSNPVFANSTQDFTRLFIATTRAFERDALRITKQIYMDAPRKSAKRSNGK